MTWLVMSVQMRVVGYKLRALSTGGWTTMLVGKAPSDKHYGRDEKAFRL